METIEKIKQQIATNTVLLYMKGTPMFPQCGFSSQAAQILQACAVDFDSVNVLENPDIRADLPKVSNWPTFPQLFINGELIGGSDIMLEMYKSGELQKKLQAVIAV